MQPEEFYDRVHGAVRLSSLAGVLATSEEFRRLDGIRQLGGCAVVFPSATHTRREHSLGVAHLARRAGEALRARYPALVGADDVLGLEVAGLVHDLGHGPLSHLFEQVAREGDAAWSHETMGIRLLDRLLAREREGGAFAAAFAAAAPQRPAAAQAAFVRHLVLGIEGGAVPAETGRGPEKAFLFELVHSRASGLDVDRMDYLLRDALAVFGATRPFRVDRLLDALRVAEGGARLAFEAGAAGEVCELHALRARMHRSLYQHPSVLVADGLLRDLVGALDAAEGLVRKGVGDVDAYVRLTDEAILAPRAEARLEALRRRVWERPWFAGSGRRVPLETRPRCARCGAPGAASDRFCRACGSGEGWTGGVEDGAAAGGPLVAAEARASARALERRYPAGARVFVSDIRCGGETVEGGWRAYDPHAGVTFCDEAGEVVEVEGAAPFVAGGHERVAYVFPV